jgi:hypothetical protein
MVDGIDKVIEDASAQSIPLTIAWGMTRATRERRGLVEGHALGNRTVTPIGALIARPCFGSRGSSG